MVNVKRCEAGKKIVNYSVVDLLNSCIKILIMKHDLHYIFFFFEKSLQDCVLYPCMVLSIKLNK
jgi:hypothetical protein